MKRLAINRLATFGTLLTLIPVSVAQSTAPTTQQSNVSGVKRTADQTVIERRSTQGNASDETRHVAKPQQTVTFPGLPETPATDTAAEAKNPAVDTRPLWNLFNARRYDELAQRIEVLKKYYPAWQAPTELLAFVTIRKAVQTRNPEEILAAYRKWPPFFSCKRIGNLWALADAEARMGNADERFAIYRRILSSCSNEDDRLATLSRAVEEGLPDQVESLVSAEASRISRSKPSKVHQDLHYRFYTKWLYDSLSGEVWETANHAADAIGQEALARKDAGAVATIGWLSFKQNNAGAAIPWFRASLGWSPKADTALGLALSLRGTGDTDSAYRIASRFQEDAQLISLRRDILDERIRSAYDAGRFGDVINLVEEDARLGPLRPSVLSLHAWASYQKGDEKAAASIFEGLYRETRDASSAVGLIFALMRLQRYRYVLDLSTTLPGALTAILQPEQNASLDVQEKPIVALASVTDPRDMRYVFFSSWLYDAMQAQDFKMADWVMRQIQEDIPKKHSASLDAEIGWVEFDIDNYGDATSWFMTAVADAPANWPGAEDASYGLALAQMKAGDTNGAAATARAWVERSARLRRLYGDVVTGQAQRAYDSGDYKRSLEVVRLAGQSLGPERDLQMLESWNYYQLGELRQAESGFEALYRAQPDEQSASGLAYALQRLGDLPRLQQIAQSNPGTLKLLADKIVGEDYYNRGYFLRALRVAPKQFPDLNGITSPVLVSGFTTWSTSGSLGTSRLTGISETNQAQVILGPQRFTFGVDVLRLDAGGAAMLFHGLQPAIGWSKEADVSPFLRLGLTPLNGEVSPTVTGEIGTTVAYRRSKLTTSLYRQPVTQSLLSFTGIRDSTTGVSFGRVVETGAKIDLYRQLSPHWEADLGSAIGERTGQHVANNEHFSGSVALNYSINASQFKYLTIGPAYQYETFERNLSSFTIGNGGYYSPKWFHKAGMAMNFHTPESRRSILKGTAFFGLQTARENIASATGTNGQIALQAANLVCSHWTLQGNLSYVNSPQFHSVAIAFQLSFNLQPKRKLFSADLWAPTTSMSTTSVR